MSIYYLPINVAYYETIAEYIHRNYSTNLLNLKIIVPTAQDCQYLQQCLILKASSKNLLLPKIVPINNIHTEGDANYNLAPQMLTNYNKRRFYQIGMMARILTNTLADLSLHTAFVLAPSILDIMRELKLNNILPEKLLSIEYQDKAQHYINSVDTLHQIYNLWEQEHSQDESQICRALFDNYIEELNGNENLHSLIIGTYGNNYVEQGFIRSVIQQPRGSCVLPPIVLSNDRNLSYLLEGLSLEEKKYTQLPIEYSEVTESSYKRFINDDIQDINHDTSNIEILLFDDIQSQIIYALKIAEKYNNFALIVPNAQIAQNCRILLRKYNISYSSHISNNIHHSNQFTLLALIAEDLAHKEFSIKSFLNICAHPYIANAKVKELDYFIRKNPTSRALNDVIKHAEKLDLSAISTYLKRKKFLQGKLFSFSKFIREYISLAENFSDKIYTGNAGKKLVEILQDIQNLSLDVRLSAEEYRDLFLSLTKNIVYTDNTQSKVAKIHLIPPDCGCLYNYEAFYILECNQGTFPIEDSYDPWLGENIRHNLQLSNNSEKTHHYNYIFYLLLHKAKLYLARSQYAVGEVLLESRLLGHLKSLYNIQETHITSNKLEALLQEEDVNDPQAIISLPDQISATSIERLMKDPHDFWIRNILKIRELDSLDGQKEQFRNFGIFVHRVIELFSDHQYMKDIKTPQDRWQAISELVLKQQKIQNISAAVWRPKIAKIFFLFADFINIREGDYKLYTEYKGSMTLNLGYRDIIITSIADRIEVKENGDITILDFKTGTIPTKDDVKKGLAVQMVIEAIILAEGGFKGIKWNKKSVTCIYIRIGSQLDAPEYLEIDLSHEDIQQHKKGLEALLRNYDRVNVNNFQPPLN